VQQLKAESALATREPWMKPHEAAAYTGKTTKRLWEMARAGQLKHGRDGGSFRYRLSDLDAWLLGHAEEAS
jgi:excisionase family DNA binding protein